jgi:hypothetical protein
MGDTGSALATGDGGDDGSDRLQDAAGAIAGRVGETLQRRVETGTGSQLTRTGDLLDQIAQAVYEGSQQLRSEQPQVARVADFTAGRIGEAAQYLRGTDVNGLRRGAEDFARRQPALFVGGAMVLGLAATRFLKASPAGAARPATRPAYGRTPDGSSVSTSRAGLGAAQGVPPTRSNGYGSAAMGATYGTAPTSATGATGYDRA